MNCTISQIGTGHVRAIFISRMSKSSKLNIRYKNCSCSSHSFVNFFKMMLFGGLKHKIINFLFLFNNGFAP